MKRTNFYLESWKKNRWELPVVPIVDGLNPFVEDRVKLYAILGLFLPYESMKSLAGLGLLTDAKKKGLIKPGVTTIVEATSGATGLALTHFGLACPFEAREIVLIMNDDVPLGKRAAPKFAGATIEPPARGLSGIQTARKLGWQPDWHNLDQYENAANTKFYREWAAPHVLNQMPVPPTVFVSPVGTGGTVIGFSEGFRETIPDIHVVGAMCALGVEVPGMRDLKGMADIRLPWEMALDERIEVEMPASYLATFWFQWMQSLPVGLSSGAAYVAALLALKRHKDAGTLDNLRARSGRGKGEISVLIVFHDGARPYLVDRFPMLHHNYQDLATAPLPWKLLW